ncbi:hypothetical protein [Nocardia sp. XZ_19_369]|uniref:hypothetical protein n=1 Tax=Nocardia sp. XZ_19_369 TaxID=2769487 RepID=UPI00189041C3|nr:hypothetical protein [Nocardia sp. XZ_19_369]
MGAGQFLAVVSSCAFADTSVVIFAADMLAPAFVAVDPHDHPESIGIFDVLVVDQPTARRDTIREMS